MIKFTILGEAASKAHAEIITQVETLRNHNDIPKDLSDIEEALQKLEGVAQALLHEDQINESNYYLISDDEIDDPSEFLRDCASNLANNCGEYEQLERLAYGLISFVRPFALLGLQGEQLERLAYGLISADDVEVAEDYDGECKILIEGNFYGYSPISYAKDDMGNDMIFDSREMAQDWIDERGEEAYYPRHGESGRPTYTITEA